MDKDIKILPGDLFMINSNKTGAKIVKFFQVAPTCWHHIYRKIFGGQEKVLYYHVGMFMDEERTIEQQKEVEIDKAERRLNTDKSLFIARMKNVDSKDRVQCVQYAINDLGQGYDILNIFGKTLTWLTGIKFFARYMQYPKAEICINRVAHWYKQAFGEKFGVKTHSELTAHNMYKYIKAHPEKFEIVYERII